jgi:hypothetical protein
MTHQRKDNKPLTLRDLLDIIGSCKLKYDSTITMSSDEEGNEMLNLHAVDVENGKITLWPAHL